MLQSKLSVYNRILALPRTGCVPGPSLNWGAFRFLASSTKVLSVGCSNKRCPLSGPTPPPKFRGVTARTHWIDAFVDCDIHIYYVQRGLYR